MKKGVAFLVLLAFFVVQFAFPLGANEAAQKLLVVAAEAGSTVPGGNVMHAFDGDINTFWQASFDSVFPKWVTADLGEVKTVERVSFAFYNENHAPKDFELLISRDGENFQSVHSVENNQEGQLDISFVPVQARFVKFYCTAGTPNPGLEWAVPTIREMEIFGAAGKMFLQGEKMVQSGPEGITVAVSASAQNVTQAISGASLTASFAGSDGSELYRQSETLNLAAGQAADASFTFTHPQEIDYTITLSLTDAGGQKLCDDMVLAGKPYEQISDNKTYFASSVFAEENRAEMAFDNDFTTRWNSALDDGADPFLGVDFGAPMCVGGITLNEFKFYGEAPAYLVQCLTESGWKDVFAASLPITNDAYLAFPEVVATQLRVVFHMPAAGVLVTIFELGVKGFRAPTADSEPPSAPQNLRALRAGGRQVQLSWSESTDNEAVEAYVVRSGGKMWRTRETSLWADGLEPGTSYGFTVEAVDTNGNHSQKSDVLTASTLENIALGKTYDQSSQWEGGGYDAAQAFDGNVGQTRWNSANGEMAGAYISVNFGAPTRVSGVSLFECKTYSQITSFSLSGLSGGEWKTLFVGKTITDGALIELNLCEVEALKFTVQSTGGPHNAVTIYEFEAYGETKRESEEIFPAAVSALGQSEGHGAELAFDQNHETWWEDEGASGTWLEASFGKQRAVTGIWVSTPCQVGAFTVQAEKNGAWETAAACPAGEYDGPIDMALCITDKIRIVFDAGPAALSQVRIFAQTWLENGTGLSKEGWFSMPFSAQDESVAGNFLYLVGGYTSFGVGCTWWGSIKENETQFVGDQIGELVIDYMDESQSRIPLIIGYNIWFKELFINGMEPFLTGAAQETETVSALKGALHLSGAWEQTDDPVLKIRVPNKAVKSITIADDPVKPGAPLIKGGYLVEQDNANSLNGEIPITVDHSFFETHTIDAQNPYPQAVQENMKKVCRRIMTYEEDFENVAPYEIPAGYNKTRVEFSGTSLANIATGIFYENVADMAGKITESGMMMESTIGAPNWFYNGWGAWMNANPGTGTYSAFMFSRNHKGATALSSLGYLAEAQSVANYDHQQLMYFPNNNLSIKGKAVPGHWTVLVNDPMYYMNNPGAGTNYTYERFGEDYKNIGGVETDGHGLTMMFIYNIWKNTGSDPQWVTENWDYISEAVDYIQWCLDNPDVSFCENGLLYAESEATMMGFSMYCNIPCYLGVRMYAEMAEAAGKTGEAARWTRLADGLEEAILTHFSTGEKWNLAKAGYYHDSAMPLYADYLGLDAKNKAPQEWVSRSENTYEEDRNAYIGDLYIGPRGFGYDHNFMTQTALLLDKTSEYNQFIQQLVKLCYSPRLPKPYIVPESMSYDVRTGAYRRQGDLGNLAQQGETVKTMLMWTGVSDETGGTVTIMPRLPQNWNVKVSEMQVPRGQSVVSFSAGYPQENQQTASVTLNSGPANGLRFRFGPFSPEAKTAAATINGAPCAAELAASGDSKWVWVTVENLAPGQTYALSASVDQEAVPTIEKPPVPTATATKTTITVQNPSGLCEYSLDQKTWNSDGVFENLTPDTGYTLWCRFKNPTAQQDGAPVAVFVKTKGQGAVSGPRAAAVRTTNVKTQEESRPFGTSRMVEQNGRQMVLYEIDEEKALASGGAVSAVLEETAQTIQISLAGTTVQKLSEQNKSILAGSAACYVELAASDISLAEGAAALGKKPEEISVLICIDMREEQKAAVSLTFTDGKREAEQEDFTAPVRLCIPAVWGEGAYTAAFLENDEARPVPTLFSGGTATAVIRRPGTYFITGGDGAFSDIGGHWAANDVSDLARRLVVNGYGGKKFMPNKAVSRGEFAAAAYRALALPSSAGDAGFADVKPAMWYAEAVGAAFNAGIVAGTGENTFSPDEAVKRQEAMAILARAAKSVGITAAQSETQPQSFRDWETLSPWAREDAAFCAAAGLVEGDGGNLLPQKQVTRAEMAAMWRRLLQKAGYINEL